jgi:chromosome segregation protein
MAPSWLKSNMGRTTLDRGAHFYKCDFQVHTPRDQNWNGANAVTDDERRLYAETLIAACRAKKLAALAITDHHDMAFVEHVRRAAIEEVRPDGTALPASERITVFPGMELTLGVPCQAIIILDADFPENLFPALQTALNINPVPDSAARNGNVERLHSIVTFSQLHEKLDEYVWLKGRYIILPNVSGEGKVSLLRDGQHGKYAGMPCVGGYIDGALEKLKLGFKMRLDGKVKEWGHKRIGCFQTSDNRQEDHGNLGVHTTWVKWAVPTAEALRQACLAQESRISQEEPRLPAITISRIEVSNSTFLGPIDLELNGQYSSLIGGRGTGKSTILEYLRWALCDQPPGVSDEDSPNYQARRARLIESTLTALGATVDITFILHNVPHVVRRHSKDGSVMLKIGDTELRACTEGEVRALLPIQAYSQKQLSNVSVRIDELTRFLTAPIRAELAGLKSRGEEAASRLRQRYTARQRAQSLARDLANRDLAARSLQEQATSIQASLTGLTPEDRLILDRERGYSAASRIVGSWTGGIQPIRDMLAELRQKAETNAAGAAAASSAVEPEIFAEVAADYQSVMSAAAALAAQIDQELGAFVEREADPSSAWGKWNTAVDAFRKAYQEATQRSSAHKERMDELEQINARLNQHLTETVRIQEQLSGLQGVEAHYATERASWIAQREEYDRLMEGQCRVLTQNSAGTIRATLRRFANTNGFVERLREFLSGSNVRRDKLESIGTIITTAPDPAATWQAVLRDLEMLANFKPDEEGAGQRPNTAVLMRAGLSVSDLDKIAARLSAADWLELSLVEIDSEPVFEYQSRENDYIPFKNASAGQQATALLKTLLNEVGPPLVIDQPEEDLDNPVISEIVEQLWIAKQKRQIIFASHNANLVVNGDAELVVWCDYRKAGDQSGGKIAGEGAIDVPLVRDAIKKIMEGGEAAFKARQEKYGF